MSEPLRPPRDRDMAVRRGLRMAAWCAVILYCGWNLYWLCRLRVPPALFLALTGLPSPTTGGTRSFRALCAGEWHESLRWNAMTVPILALLSASIVGLFLSWLRTRRLRLPQWFLWAWCFVLIAAWALKLAGDRAYW